MNPVAEAARRAYVNHVTQPATGVWWDAVVITASSARQAELYRQEIARRRDRGTVPSAARFLVVPDAGDQRVGSGTATFLALAVLAEGETWWRGRRVLLLHSGGDSRRLPAYSLAGKLFSAVPVTTGWGEASTIFDETLSLSTAWAEKMGPGLLVGSGDVLLTFRATDVEWDRLGVTGIAMRQPVEVGSRHGVYVLGPEREVYAFLQKPSAVRVREAGGMLPGETVALDTGLLRFDSDTAAALTRLGREFAVDGRPPVLDLYRDLPQALLGGETEARLAAALKGTRFSASLVEGEFIHAGSTSHFRRLMTGPAGVVVDSVLECGSEMGPGSLAIECEMTRPLRVARGGMAHGLAGIGLAVEVPEDTVVHQVPVTGGVVIRVFGVGDDPKTATWFGHPMEEALDACGITADEVWGEDERCLWNARLFAVGTPDDAWRCAAWLARMESDFSLEEWRRCERMSLASSTAAANVEAVAEAKGRRARRAWQLSAMELCRAGADLRPLLEYAPGVSQVAETGQALRAEAEGIEAEMPTEAAARHFQAHIFLGQAGLHEEAAEEEHKAFGCVRNAVERGAALGPIGAGGWVHERVEVSAPARVDFAGGWSDTPPFCLDWGGVVLNAAVTLDGRYPIRTVVTRLKEPVIRCVAEDAGETAEYRSVEESRGTVELGSGVAIQRAALGMLREGSGLEIRTSVDLPMGSGLGTSSILGATVVKALATMAGVVLDEEALSRQVLGLEQAMGTGGGWQDQAGAIYPGAKLLLSGPGLRQRLRVEAVRWTRQREAEFSELFVMYFTGIRRIARNLLAQVMGSYLARETRTVQILHSIKTLAMEMRHAMEEGDWRYLGELMDRHWALNIQLDPNTTNAPINALLGEVRPYLSGAKLAGAGGGGVMMLLARSPEEARRLRELLGRKQAEGAGVLYHPAVSATGLETVCYG